MYEAANPFREFIEHFYTERKKYKEAVIKDDLCDAKMMLLKLIMNSLYGKFG